MPVSPLSDSTSTNVSAAGPNQPPVLVSKSSKVEVLVTRLRFSVSGEPENPIFRVVIFAIRGACAIVRSRHSKRKTQRQLADAGGLGRRKDAAGGPGGVGF